MRILKRILKLTLLTALLTTCALVVIRYFFADQLITAALQRAGATEASVHLAALGTDQLRFDFLNAAFPLENGTTLHIQTKQISLQYDLQRLLHNKKCDLLTIEEVALSQKGESKSTASPSLQLPEKITLLEDSIRARLPIEKIRLEKILLRDNFPAQVKERNIHLTASANGTALQAQATFQADPQTELFLDLHSPDARHATAELIGKQGEEEILRTKVNLQPDRLAGKVSLLLQPINELFLRPLTAERNIPVPEGSLDGSFSLPLPLTPDAALQANLTVSDSNKHQIHLEASGTPDTRQASLLLFGKKGRQEFLKTDLTMQDQRIKGSYSLHCDQLRSFLAPYLPQALPAIKGTFSGTVDLPLPENQDKEFKAMVAASALALPSLTASSAQISVTGKLNGNDVHFDRDSTFHGSKLTLGGTTIDECSLDLAGDFSRKGDQLLLDFANKQKIHIKSLKAGSTRIQEILLQTPERLRFDCNKTTWSFAKNTLQAAPLAITVGSVDIKTGPLQCSFSALRSTNAGPEIMTTLSSPSLIITTPQAEVPLKDVAGNFRLQKHIISSKLQANPEHIPGKIQAEVEHSLTRAEGFFTLRTDKALDLNEEGITLAGLLNTWQFPFDLDKGSVHLETRGEWQRSHPFQLTLLANVKEGSGYFQKVLFENLNTQQDLMLLPELGSQREGKISVERVIGGLDVHKLSAKTALLSTQTGKQPVVQLRNLQAGLLQGTVSSPEIRYDLNTQQSNFTVNVSSVDLTTIVELMKVKDMHATGKISGKIPVTIDDKKVSVEKGELYNDPPGGEINYTAPDAHLTGLPEYAIKAIRDFRYTSLKSTAQYAPSGQLDLAVGLQGISPELDKNREVHLNINIEQNLNTLLQGLRYSKGLSEKIDKRVQQRYR
ncbi:MAG: YdbH domain-containing protein [Candidatus Electrothrix scaldis]|nr:MAG: YdbH domain-containing protein [Candidatus Electrothrix sp. GW3-3]